MQKCGAFLSFVKACIFTESKKKHKKSNKKLAGLKKVCRFAYY